MNTPALKSKKWPSRVRIHPWIGNLYKDGFRGGRLLILGESQYDPEHKFNVLASTQTTAHNASVKRLLNELASSTQTLIREASEGIWSPRIYTVVQQAFTGSGEAGVPRHKFWHSVAYYNFVQSLVGHKPGNRPTAQMWADAIEPLLIVMEYLKPQYIVVLGKGLWSRLPEWSYVEPPLMVRGKKHEICSYTIGKHRGLAIALPHPTGSRGFSAKTWHEVLNRFFERSAHDLSN